MCYGQPTLLSLEAECNDVICHLADVAAEPENTEEGRPRGCALPQQSKRERSHDLIFIDVARWRLAAPSWARTLSMTTSSRYAPPSPRNTLAWAAPCALINPYKKRFVCCKRAAEKRVICFDPPPPPPPRSPRFTHHKPTPISPHSLGKYRHAPPNGGHNQVRVGGRGASISDDGTDALSASLFGADKFGGSQGRGAERTGGPW